MANTVQTSSKKGNTGLWLLGGGVGLGTALLVVCTGGVLASQLLMFKPGKEVTATVPVTTTPATTSATVPVTTTPATTSANPPATPTVAAPTPTATSTSTITPAVKAVGTSGRGGTNGKQGPGGKTSEALQSPGNSDQNKNTSLEEQQNTVSTDGVGQEIIVEPPPPRPTTGAITVAGVSEARLESGGNLNAVPEGGYFVVGTFASGKPYRILVMVTPGAVTKVQCNSKFESCRVEP